MGGGKKTKRKDGTTETVSRNASPEPEVSEFQRPTREGLGEVVPAPVEAGGTENEERWYANYAEGHEKPEEFVTYYDADMHTWALYDIYVEKFEDKYGKGEVSDKYSRIQDEGYKKAAAYVKEKTQMIVKLFDEGYLVDPVVSARVRDYPPIVTLESREFFEVLLMDKGLNRTHARGFFRRKSNRCFFLYHSYKKEPEAENMKLMVHELHHYAAWLGGGQDVRWRDAHGKPVEASHSHWLEEGMTEFLSQQFVRDLGYEPEIVNYRPGALFSSILQTRLVEKYGEENGKKILRKAYFTGDYTYVRAGIDDVLGKGTFKKMMRKWCATSAMGILVDKLQENGIDLAFSDTQLDILLDEKFPLGRNSREENTATHILKAIKRSPDFSSGMTTLELLDSIYDLVDYEPKKGEIREFAWKILNAIAFNPGNRTDLLNLQFLEKAMGLIAAQPLEGFEEKDTFAWLFSGMLENPEFRKEWLTEERLGALLNITKISMETPEVGGAFKILLATPGKDLEELLKPESVKLVNELWKGIEEKAGDLTATRNAFYEIFRDPDLDRAKLEELRDRIENYEGDPLDILKE